jgi:PAS domain S-box-containing protein
MPEEVERLRRAIRLLSDAIVAFSEAGTDPARLVDTVAKNCAMAVRDTCIVLLSEPDGELVPAAMWDPDPKLLAEFVIEFAKGFKPQVSQQVLASGKPLLMPKIHVSIFKDWMAPSLYALNERIGVCGLVYAPMRVRGEVIGVIVVVRHRTTEPLLDQLDADLVQDLGNHAAIAISNARLTTQVLESEAIRLAKEEADRANRFLDAVIEHIPDMVFVKDAARLAFTRFNRAGEELLGVPRKDLLGKNDYDFFPPDEAAFFQAKDRETLNNKQLVEIAEEPIKTANGQRWLHTKKVPILDDDGTPLYLLGISQDITDRKRTDTDLRRAKDQAERASRELEAFSYSVAHDLRAPLRGIDGFSQALIEDYADKLDAGGRRYLDRVRESAQRMALLIDDLLNLSKVTRSELNVRKVDLSALAATSISSLQRLDPSRNVTVEIEPNLSVEADPRMLAIALDNLFGNAWKFTSKTPAARIELCGVDRDGHRAFAIRDNGAGFDMQYANKLFGVFQRLHTETEFPGTGIGLATVARIIHRHRGQVAAEGTPGQGATFYFTLGTEAEV